MGGIDALRVSHSLTDILKGVIPWSENSDTQFFLPDRGLVWLPYRS